MRVLSLLSALPLAIVAVPSMPSKFILGVWLDTDTPAGFNAKMGRKMPSFEAAVSIPYAVVNGTVQLDPLPGQDARYLSNAFSWNDNSDASLFMTVYADQTNGNQQGMDLVTDDAITHLANRLHSVQQMGRQVYMRWLPEMSGAWMLYGQQPDAYVALWNRMGAIFRQVAPEVMLVWSPNYDTRDNSYWPGPQYVDWIGSSCYWKGWGVNGLIDQSYAMDTVSFIYQNYAAVYNLPFVISEASGSWESGPGVSPVTGESFTSVTNQVDQATFQTSFWSGILAPEVMAQYPLLKAAYIFEVAKTEEFFSDFR
ncbi:glycoside hydrolase superfamily [Chytriomyces sp. MP71]|nr:glycoside hydrolase superfamily [Chytriomyces sp. MP71]